MMPLIQTPSTNRITIDIMVRFIRENPGPAVVYFMTLLLVPIYDVGLPHLYGKVIHAIQSKQSIVAPLVAVLTVIIIINIGVLIAEWNETYNTFPALQSIIRKTIMENVFIKHENDFDEQKTASLVVRIVKLPAVLYNMVEQYKMAIIPQTLVIISISSYFFMQDPQLGIGILLAMIIMFVIVIRAPEQCGVISMEREDTMNKIHDQTDDILRNMMSIYNSNSYESEDLSLDDIHIVYRNLGHKTQTCIMKNKIVLSITQIAIFVFFIWRCYKLLNSKHLTTAMFVSMFLIMMSLNSSINKFTGQVKDLVFRKGVMDASNGFLARPPNNQVPASNVDTRKQTKENSPNTVQFENVTYIYTGAKDPIIQNFTLSIPRGQRLLFVGRIGSGKSTLLRLLMKYKIPTRGEIYIQGTPYSKISTKEIRSMIGYVPQMPILFNRSIYENITYGTANVSKEDVKDILSKLGLDNIFDNLVEGLDSNVGKGGSKLSGGQRQIVWIIRVLLHDPEILMMDEPTASIDDHTKDIVRALLMHIMKDRTVIMVTHDKYLEQFADRIVEINNGQIMSDQPMGGSAPPRRTF
jgi:ABC-type multidrug transport system fused ATPase/permease subunit